MTSEDVRISWEVFAADPRTNASAFKDIDHYETPDPSTFVVKMKQPNAWSIGSSGFTRQWYYPKEMVDNELAQTVAIASGAYMVEKFDPMGRLDNGSAI